MGWADRRQYGEGESPFGPAPGDNRYRFQDEGGYVVGPDGTTQHYEERGARGDIPDELQQGPAFGQPYGPAEGPTGGRGPGPYYHNYGGGLGQGATTATSDPRYGLDEDRLEREFIPPNEPRYRSDTDLINTAEKQLEALFGMRDALLELINHLSNGSQGPYQEYE